MQFIGLAFLLIVLLSIPGGVLGAILCLRKRRVGLAFVFAVLALVASQVIPETYFDPYPFVDTIRSSKFTIERFETIRPGMTKVEVTELIGPQVGDYASTAPHTGEFCERQTNDGKLKFWDFAWFNATVCYDREGRVINTNAFWQQD